MPDKDRKARKIAYYCVATHLGGGERSVLDLMTRVEASSAGWYRPWAILPREEGPLVDKLREHGIPYNVLPMPKGIFGMSRSRPVKSLLMGAMSWKAVRNYMGRLEELIASESPTLIHTTGIKCHALAARLGEHIPVLWHLRDIMNNGAARTLLRRLRLRPNLYTVANSYATAMAFQPDETNPAVVYNGIDADHFEPGDDPLFRDRFGVGPEVPIVGIVGVLQRGKGLTGFLDMVALLKADGVAARFVIVGDEIYDTGRDAGFRAELEARASELGIEDVVEFVGYLPDSAQVMRGLDVLVSASTHPESFGRVLIEAMASGVPVVASGLGGSLEIIEDRISGRLFPPGDANAMAGAVRAVVRDNAQRETYIRNGRARVLERFNLRNYVAGVVRSYDRILCGELEQI